MAFKINIGNNGNTYKLEVNTEELIGKKIGEKIEGKEISKELEGYDLEITGTSDIAGFPGMKSLEGQGKKRLLLTKGFGMKTKPRREGKKEKYRFPDGLRLKKSIRGNTISKDIIQINTKVIKEGSKKLEEVFPEQVKAREEKAEKKKQALMQFKQTAQQPAEQK